MDPHMDQTNQGQSQVQQNVPPPPTSEHSEVFDAPNALLMTVKDLNEELTGGAADPAALAAGGGPVSEDAPPPPTSAHAKLAKLAETRNAANILHTALKGLHELTEGQADPAALAASESRVRAAVDTLAQATGGRTPPATASSYTASSAAPQLTLPPSISGLSRQIMTTLSEPALITKLSSLMDLVMSLMREIQQEEARIQGEAIVKGTDQGIGAAKADVAAGKAQAQQTRNQAISQIVSATSNLVQAAVQIGTMRGLTNDPEDVQKMQETDKEGNPAGPHAELAIAKDKVSNNQKLLDLKKEFERKYPDDDPNVGNPDPKTSIRKINNRLKELEKIPEDKRTLNNKEELNKLTTYRKESAKFLKYHKAETNDPKRIANPYDGNKTFKDSQGKQIPDIKHDTIRECDVADQKAYNTQMEYKTTLISKYSSRMQAISGLANQIGSIFEKGTEAGMGFYTASKQKQAAEYNAIKQLAQTAQGLMQGLQQMSDKGHESVIQALGTLIHTLESFIQTTQQNWQR